MTLGKMKIGKDTYIAGGYYLDFDSLGQWRIFGPNNHLYLGLVDIPRHKIRIDSVEEDQGDRGDRGNQGDRGNRCAGVKIRGAFIAQSLNLYLPVMGDVRTLREITKDFTNELRQFLKVRESQHTLHGETQPMRVEFVPAQNPRSRGNKDDNSRPWTVDRGPRLVFRRDYGEFFYQSSFEFPPFVAAEETDEPYKGYCLSIRSEKWEEGVEIPFVLRCETNDASVYEQSCVLLGREGIDFSVFGKDAEKVERFWERTTVEIEHMLCWGKTSGDRFGTVFPRDWMESAALATSNVASGVGDIPPAGIDYILKKSLAHVNEEGEGWHEDVVGEYKYKHEAAGLDLYDRKMIDIEPWYFICLQWVTEKFWEDKESVEKLKRVAKFILRHARNDEFVTFEPLPKEQEIPGWQRSFRLKQGYHVKGDWRDSEWAYKHIHPVVAPFSVSAVLYPEALKIIREIREEIGGIREIGVEQGELEELIKKWERKKETYRFEDYNGNTGFALALYDAWKQLRVHHLDEAYLYFLSENYRKEEVLGFARRMLDFEYFYSESGPLLVARNNEMGYTDEEYHGLVVWTKQAAFAVGGLAKVLRHRRKHTDKTDSNGLNRWYLSDEESDLIRNAVKKTCENLIRAYCELDAIPELHKDSNGRAVDWMGGAGSSVQLWSAVGARRIFREYEKLQQS